MACEGGVGDLVPAPSGRQSCRAGKAMPKGSGRDLGESLQLTFHFAK